MMAWSLSVDAVNAPLVEPKGTVRAEGFWARTVKQVGPSPDWKSGASDWIPSASEARGHGFVLEVVLDARLFCRP